MFFSLNFHFKHHVSEKKFDTYYVPQATKSTHSVEEEQINKRPNKNKNKTNQSPNEPWGKTLEQGQVVTVSQ